MISLLMLVTLVLLPINCKTPTTPTDDIGGEIEILYVRANEVTNPGAPDLTSGAASVYHGKYGGKNSSYWKPDGENRWIASVGLECDGAPYFIWVNDGRVSPNPTAVQLFIRRKGDTNWIELICVVDHPLGADGKAAKFVFNHGQLRNPC